MPKREGASYQEIMARALRKPEHAAVPVFHADDPRHQELARAGLGGARVTTLKTFWKNVRTVEGDVTWAMIEAAADGVEVDLDEIRGTTVVDFEAALAMISWIDREFPKIDEGEDS